MRSCQTLQQKSKKSYSAIKDTTHSLCSVRQANTNIGTSTRVAPK